MCNETERRRSPESRFTIVGYNNARLQFSHALPVTAGILPSGSTFPQKTRTRSDGFQSFGVGEIHKKFPMLLGIQLHIENLYLFHSICGFVEGTIAGYRRSHSQRVNKVMHDNFNKIVVTLRDFQIKTVIEFRLVGKFHSRVGVPSVKLFP